MYKALFVFGVIFVWAIWPVESTRLIYRRATLEIDKNATEIDKSVLESNIITAPHVVECGRGFMKDVKNKCRKVCRFSISYE